MITDKLQGWEVKASTGKHFDVLDGIRGLAILMVVSFHTFYINPKSGIFLRVMGGINEGGWMGVPIFFVLSGFLISYPFFRQKAKNDSSWYPRGYARRRIGKIIPPYYLSLVIFASYYLVRYCDPAYLRLALGFALFSPGPISSGLFFNSSYWSLIVESHFYLILPLLFFLARGVRLQATTVGLFLVIWLVPMIVRQLTWPANNLTPEQSSDALAQFPRQLDCFAWGILFAGLFVSCSAFPGKFRFLGSLGYAGLALLLATLCLFAVSAHLFGIDARPVRWSTEAFHLLAALSAFLLLFFVFDPDCLGVRLLAQPWLRFVGIVSYEWFLLHLPLVRLFQDIFGHTGGNLFLYLLKTVVPLALTFILSVLVYRHFSLPLLDRIRNDKPAPKPARPSAASAIPVPPSS